MNYCPFWARKVTSLHWELLQYPFWTLYSGFVTDKQNVIMHLNNLNLQIILSFVWTFCKHWFWWSLVRWKSFLYRKICQRFCWQLNAVKCKTGKNYKINTEKKLTFTRVYIFESWLHFTIFTTNSWTPPIPMQALTGLALCPYHWGRVRFNFFRVKWTLHNNHISQIIGSSIWACFKLLYVLLKASTKQWLWKNSTS